MVGEDFVYLIDFGLVHEADAGRLTLTNVAPGSPAYMAPERFGSGKNVDARADVYSLACVLYECLTGRLPFSGGGVEGLAAAHRGDEPPKPSSFNPAIPVGFDAVIARGMAKEPDDRFQSAHELAVAARAALTDVSGVSAQAAPATRVRDAAVWSADTAPATPSPPRSPRERLRRGVLMAAALVVVAVIARWRVLADHRPIPVPFGETAGSDRAAVYRSRQPRGGRGRREGRRLRHRQRPQPGAGTGRGLDQPDRDTASRPGPSRRYSGRRRG